MNRGETLNEFQQRKLANIHILGIALALQDELNKELEKEGEETRSIKIKLAIPHQDVIGTNEDLIVLGADEGFGILYLKLNGKGQSNGDIVPVFLGDVIAIQFTDPTFLKKLEARITASFWQK